MLLRLGCKKFVLEVQMQLPQFSYTWSMKIDYLYKIVLYRIEIFELFMGLNTWVELTPPRPGQLVHGEGVKT